MRLENEFTVAAPLEDTWRTLLDIERVATCLPGARIEPTEEEGVYRGTMKMKLGPVTVDYRGTARLQDVDQDSHTASIAVQGREAKGQGTAAAVIENRLEPQDGATKLTAITDLKITGRQAQFGRGIMQDVAETLMGQFAERLERELRGGAPAAQLAAAPASGEGAAPAASGEEDSEVEALDVGNVLMSSGAIRYLSAAGAVMLVLAVLAATLRTSRRRLKVDLDLGL